MRVPQLVLVETVADKSKRMTIKGESVKEKKERKRCCSCPCRNRLKDCQSGVLELGKRDAHDEL